MTVPRGSSSTPPQAMCCAAAASPSTSIGPPLEWGEETTSTPSTTTTTTPVMDHPLRGSMTTHRRLDRHRRPSLARLQDGKLNNNCKPSRPPTTLRPPPTTATHQSPLLPMLRSRRLIAKLSKDPTVNSGKQPSRRNTTRSWTTTRGSSSHPHLDVTSLAACGDSKSSAARSDRS